MRQDLEAGSPESRPALFPLCPWKQRFSYSELLRKGVSLLSSKEWEQGELGPLATSIKQPMGGPSIPQGQEQAPDLPNLTHHHHQGLVAPSPLYTHTHTRAHPHWFGPLSPRGSPLTHPPRPPQDTQDKVPFSLGPAHVALSSSPHPPLTHWASSPLTLSC